MIKGNIMAYSAKFFETRKDTEFEIETLSDFGKLKLIDVTTLVPSTKGIEAFSIVFESQNPEILEQGTYTLVSSDFKDQIFIVPIGQDQDGTRYEAVFN